MSMEKVPISAIITAIDNIIYSRGYHLWHDVDKLIRRGCSRCCVTVADGFPLRNPHLKNTGVV